jgi:nucleotide-binding universal stress UspA family protein
VELSAPGEARPLPGEVGRKPVFRHVLVPLDLSAKNQRALSTALELARGDDAKVTLLHVVQTLEQLPLGDMRGFYTKLADASKKKLARHAARFAKSGVPVKELVLLSSDVLQEIVDTIDERRVDLVVLSSHRIGAQRSLRDWGTLSYKLAIVAPCPVLLVK